jgi:hypothetical protein
MNLLLYVSDYSQNEWKNKIKILKRNRLIYDTSIHDKKIKFDSVDWIPWVLYLAGLSYNGSEIMVVLVGFSEELCSAELHYFICCLYMAVLAT